jgi:hypothetical protein
MPPFRVLRDPPQRGCRPATPRAVGGSDRAILIPPTPHPPAMRPLRGHQRLPQPPAPPRPCARQPPHRPSAGVCNAACAAGERRLRPTCGRSRVRSKYLHGPGRHRRWPVFRCPPWGIGKCVSSETRLKSHRRMVQRLRATAKRVAARLTTSRSDGHVKQIPRIGRSFGIISEAILSSTPFRTSPLLRKSLDEDAFRSGVRDSAGYCIAYACGGHREDHPSSQPNHEGPPPQGRQRAGAFVCSPCAPST